MALRWGIVSAGNISHDFTVALSTLPDDEHTVIAIAARDKERAQEFAKLHDIPNAYGSYKHLAESPDVDVVYIGALNPQHFEVGMLMLEHGKHVLVEKPLCMNEKQAKKLITYAERKKLFLMEATWSRFFPAYQYVRRQIETGVLGTIQEVDVSFGFKLEADRVHTKQKLAYNKEVYSQTKKNVVLKNIKTNLKMQVINRRTVNRFSSEKKTTKHKQFSRPHVQRLTEKPAGVTSVIKTFRYLPFGPCIKQKKELGGGTILDLGIYVIQVSQWAFQEPPVAVKANGELNENGVDIAMQGELQYAGGRVAKIRTSAKEELANKAVIKGSKGEITLLQFWCPTTIIDLDGKKREWVLPKGKHKTNFHNSEGMRYEAEEVRKCILRGKLQSEHMSHNDSLLLAQIEDSIRAQVGVVYEEDKQ